MIFKCRWLYSWKFYVSFFNYSWGIPPHTHHDVCSLYRMLFLKMTLATSLEPMLSARYSKQSVYKHHLIQSAKWLYTGSNSHSILGIAKLRPRGFIKSLKGIIFQSVLCFFFPNYPFIFIYRLTPKSHFPKFIFSLFRRF